MLQFTHSLCWSCESIRSVSVFSICSLLRIPFETQQSTVGVCVCVCVCVEGLESNHTQRHTRVKHQRLTHPQSCGLGLCIGEFLIHGICLDVLLHLVLKVPPPKGSSHGRGELSHACVCLCVARSNSTLVTLHWVACVHTNLELVNALLLLLCLCLQVCNCVLQVCLASLQPCHLR